MTFVETLYENPLSFVTMGLKLMGRDVLQIVSLFYLLGFVQEERLLLQTHALLKIWTANLLEQKFAMMAT